MIEEEHFFDFLDKIIKIEGGLKEILIELEKLDNLVSDLWHQDELDAIDLVRHIKHSLKIFYMALKECNRELEENLEIAKRECD